MTGDEFFSLLNDYRVEFAMLVDRFLKDCGPDVEMGAFPEHYVDWSAEDIEQYLEAVPSGWVLVVERHNPMQLNGEGAAYVRSLSPAMQSPGHSTGMLHVALHEGDRT